MWPRGAPHRMRTEGERYELCQNVVGATPVSPPIETENGEHISYRQHLSNTLLTAWWRNLTGSPEDNAESAWIDEAQVANSKFFIKTLRHRTEVELNFGTPEYHKVLGFNTTCDGGRCEWSALAKRPCMGSNQATTAHVPGTCRIAPEYADIGISEVRTTFLNADLCGFLLVLNAGFRVLLRGVYCCLLYTSPSPRD